MNDGTEMKNRRTLFQLGADASALDALLEELEGDLSDPAVATAIDEWLHENRSALHDKLDGYAALVRECEARAAARKDEAKRLLELARNDESKAHRLKERLKFFLEERGESKIETARYKISLVQNGGKAPLLLDEEVDWAEIGNDYPFHVQARWEPQKDSIRADLEAGECFPFARLGERERSLRIR